MKKKLSPKNLYLSFKYAFNGYKTAFKKEMNMKVHTFIAVIVIITGIILKLNQIEWVFLVLAIGLVISAEIINTTIENLVDLVTKEYHDNAKIAKDTAAAFVLVLSITAAIIGLLIFIPRLITLIGG